MKDAGQFDGDDFPNLTGKPAWSAALRWDACFALFPAAPTLLLTAAAAAAPVPLFDGKTLAGWEGGATWRKRVTHPMQAVKNPDTCTLYRNESSM